MAQSTKHLPYKHEGLNFTSRSYMFEKKKQTGMVAQSIFLVLMKQKQAYLWAHLPARLAYSVSSRTRRDIAKNQGS